MMDEAQKAQPPKGRKVRLFRYGSLRKGACFLPISSWNKNEADKLGELKKHPTFKPPSKREKDEEGFVGHLVVLEENFLKLFQWGVSMKLEERPEWPILLSSGGTYRTFEEDDIVIAPLEIEYTHRFRRVKMPE